MKKNEDDLICPKCKQNETTVVHIDMAPSFNSEFFCTTCGHSWNVEMIKKRMTMEGLAEFASKYGEKHVWIECSDGAIYEFCEIPEYEKEWIFTRIQLAILIKKSH